MADCPLFEFTMSLLPSVQSGIKKVSDTIGINVFVYSFDGAGDAVFPSVLPTTTDILNNFFAELPKVTPTDFIVNKDTLVTIPLSQGL